MDFVISTNSRNYIFWYSKTFSKMIGTDTDLHLLFVRKKGNQYGAEIIETE